MCHYRGMIADGTELNLRTDREAILCKECDAIARTASGKMVKTENESAAGCIFGNETGINSVIQVSDRAFLLHEYSSSKM